MPMLIGFGWAKSRAVPCRYQRKADHVRNVMRPSPRIKIKRYTSRDYMATVSFRFGGPQPLVEGADGI